MFEDIYFFAGQLRTVYIAKGSFRFAPRMYLEAAFKNRVVDWSQADKEDRLLAMERNPIKDIEIKHILKAALMDKINDREIYRKGIGHSYYYEGFTAFKAEGL